VLELSKERLEQLMRARPYLGLALWERLSRILARDLEHDLARKRRARWPSVDLTQRLPKMIGVSRARALTTYLEE
jgi:hypothetical protein